MCAMVGVRGVVMMLGAGGVEGSNMGFKAAEHNATEAASCFGATREEGTTFDFINHCGPSRR